MSGLGRERQRDGGERITVTLCIVPDGFEPHALLAVEDAGGERLAEVRVGAGFKLSAASAEAWAENGYRRPGGGRGLAPPPFGSAQTTWASPRKNCDVITIEGPSNVQLHCCTQAPHQVARPA